MDERRMGATLSWSDEERWLRPSELEHLRGAVCGQRLRQPPYCYSDDDCDALELCQGGDCIGVRAPEACQPPDPNPIQLIPVASLGLSFADVDADGAMELVIATESEL